ncbi:hypothetical protein IHV82_01235 [Mycobacterium avium]|nr:hypothetical protein IHV82_01235 [Mycobacterium avium]
MAGIEKLTAVPVSMAATQLAVVEPKSKWNPETKTAEPQSNADNVPLWSVTVMFPHDGSMKQLTATIAAPSAPAFEVGTQVRFNKLVARPYGIAQAGGRVNAGLYFTAESVEPAK